jgi:3-oxoadipate enol-lactonase
MATNRRIATRVGTLAAVDRGTGTPVMFWPSLFSDHRLYDRVVAEVGDSWRTISVDGPGFGRSDPPAGQVGPERYADAVADLLDELAISSAYFAGCSWGGQVGAHLAVRHKGRVRGALLMNTPLGPNTGGISTLAVATRWVGSSAFFGRGVARSMASAVTRREHPDRIDEFVTAITSFDRTPAARTVRTVMGTSTGLSDVLSGIDVPVAFLMGADDALCPVDRMMPIAQSTPGATVAVVPGCGHLAPLEAPETVVQVLNELASRVTTPRIE